MSARRYTGGVTDMAHSDPAGAFATLDPTKYSIYREDFSAMGLGAVSIGAQATGFSGVWMYACETNMNITVEADAGVTGACLRLENGGANDNEFALLQKLPGGFCMASGKKFFMETRFELTSATTSDGEIFIGLSQGVVTLDANWFATNGTARTFDDGVGWVKYDGTDDISFIVGENDVFDTYTHIATPVTATWYKCSMYYDGTYIYTYLDDVLVAQNTPGQIPVTPCAVTFYHKSGKAEQTDLRIDYLTIMAEM